jgi:hypothetical protein
MQNIQDENRGRKFFFGKHRGEYVKDVIVNDTQYITWSMKNINWFWYNQDEVELYKSQLQAVRKPKSQYDIVMESIK